MRKNIVQETNSIAMIIISFLFLVFGAIKLLIESGKLVTFLLFGVIGICLYRIIIAIEKKRREKPVSLGRVFRKKYPIIPQYFPPKDLNPAEAGLLYNCKVDVTDLTSLIYRWTYQGLVDIQSIKGDKSGNLDTIKLVKLKNIEDTRPFFEVEIFNSIFCATNTKVIKSSSQLRYALILEDLEFHGIRKGWLYRKTGGNLEIVYIIFLILLYLSLYGLITSFTEGQGKWSIYLIIFVVLLLSCILVGGYLSGGSGLKLTDKGAKLAADVIGYRNFIKSCDENMIKLYLKNDPLFINKTLPYATAFGLETDFLKKISPLKKDWNEKYINGQKFTIGMKFLYLLIKINSRKTRRGGFYGW